VNYLQLNDLIHPKQYGFQQKSNTTTAAANLHTITTGLAGGYKVAVLFIDIMKAFDCVNFQILSKKLKLYGITDRAHDLLIDYCNAKSSDDLFNLMKSDLPLISNFLLSLNFKLSISKSKFMLFAYRNSTTSDIEYIEYEDQRIERVYYFKYLGIFFDSSLNWQKHAQTVAKSIAPYVGMLRKIRYFVDKSILMLLYYAFIHSRITYGLPIWHSVNVECKRSIHVLQNKAIKYIRFLPPLTPSCDLYDETFLNFHNLIKYEYILYIYKVKSGILKSDNALKTNLESGIRNTRQSDLLRPTLFLNSSAQSSIFYFGIILYNGFYRHLSSQKIAIDKIKLKEVKERIKKFSIN